MVYDLMWPFSMRLTKCGVVCGSQFSMTAWRRCVAQCERKGYEGTKGEREEATVCARDENRGAGFRAENEMELNDS